MFLTNLIISVQAPKFEYVSNAKPSLFAYPSSARPQKKETAAKVATAVLSTTAKVKAREKKKAAAEGESMDVVRSLFVAFLPSDDSVQDVKQENDGDAIMKLDEGTKEGDSNHSDNKPSMPRKKTEPAFEMRSNFSRVTPAQLAYISFPSDGRYQPVRPVSNKSQTSKSSKSVGGSSSVPGFGSEKYAGGGILILTDSRPDEPEDFIEAEPTFAAAALVPVQNGGHVPVEAEATGRHIALDESAPEADPPEPFEASVCLLSCEDMVNLTALFPVSF